MHERVVIALGQSLRLRGDVGLVEITQEDGSKTFDIADARAMVVPRGTRRLVGLVEIPDVHFVHEPQQGRRVARDIAALPA